MVNIPKGQKIYKTFSLDLEYYFEFEEKMGKRNMSAAIDRLIRRSVEEMREEDENRVSLTHKKLY